MPKKLQSTGLNRNLGKAFDRLDIWAVNPWRRNSLLLIVLLIGFFLGSSLGTINGVLALMDPIGAFFIVLIMEFLVRVRRNNKLFSGSKLPVRIIDSARIGLLYGLLLEGFKLL